MEELTLVYLEKEAGEPRDELSKSQPRANVCKADFFFYFFLPARLPPPSILSFSPALSPSLPQETNSDRRRTAITPSRATAMLFATSLDPAVPVCA